MTKNRPPRDGLFFCASMRENAPRVAFKACAPALRGSRAWRFIWEGRRRRLACRGSQEPPWARRAPLSLLHVRVLADLAARQLVTAVVAGIVGMAAHFDPFHGVRGGEL